MKSAWKLILSMSLANDMSAHLMSTPQERDPSVFVISTSTTFYPPESNSEDGLTLINSVKFLQENFHEVVTSFSAGDKLIVLQEFNGLQFMVVSAKSPQEPYLRFQTFILKNIATFLFGAQFENAMTKSIRQNQRDLFANYVDKFISLSQSDIKWSLMIPDWDESRAEIGKAALSNIGTPDAPFNEAFLFYNHKYVARYRTGNIPGGPGVGYLAPSDVFLLSLLEQVEFRNASLSEEQYLVADAGAISNKGCFVTLGGDLHVCVLGCGQFGNSPWVLIILFDVNKPSPEITALGQELFAKVGQTLKQEISITPPIQPPFVAGMIHFWLIDRTTGTIRESPLFIPADIAKGHSPEKVYEYVKHHLAYTGLEAVSKGLTGIVRNEMVFQYVYELRAFKFNSHGTGSVIQPKIPMKMSVFANNKSVPYWYAPANDSDSLSEWFGQSDDVHIFELYTIYLGVMNTKDVLAINDAFFNRLLQNYKAN